jgi:hypothetical protein
MVFVGEGLEKTQEALGVVDRYTRISFCHALENVQRTENDLVVLQQIIGAFHADTPFARPDSSVSFAI